MAKVYKVRIRLQLECPRSYMTLGKMYVREAWYNEPEDRAMQLKKIRRDDGQPVFDVMDPDEARETYRAEEKAELDRRLAEAAAKDGTATGLPFKDPDRAIGVVDDGDPPPAPEGDDAPVAEGEKVVEGGKRAKGKGKGGASAE